MTAERWRVGRYLQERSLVGCSRADRPRLKRGRAKAARLERIAIESGELKPRSQTEPAKAKRQEGPSATYASGVANLQEHLSCLGADDN